MGSLDEKASWFLRVAGWLVSSQVSCTSSAAVKSLGEEQRTCSNRLKLCPTGTQLEHS